MGSSRSCVDSHPGCSLHHSPEARPPQFPHLSVTVPVAQVGEGTVFLGPLARSLWARNPSEAQRGARQGAPSSQGLRGHSAQWDSRFTEA